MLAKVKVCRIMDILKILIVFHKVCLAKTKKEAVFQKSVAAIPVCLKENDSFFILIFIIY